MAEDYLKNKLDNLWTKVEENSAKGSSDRGFISAFDRMESEMQAETLNSLRVRFDKEKSYWEELIAAKEETVVRLQEEIKTEQERGRGLKEKVEELRNSQTEFLKQAFLTLDLQKRSSDGRVEHLDKEIELSRKEILDLKFQLREEMEAKERVVSFWEEKEGQWIEERDKREIEITHIKQDLYERRQKELEGVARLEENIRNLQGQLAENQKLYEAEKAGLQSLLNEKQGTIERVTQDLTIVTDQREKEKEERKQAAVERERQSVQAEEDKKRMVEQLLNRETKIKELQESLETVLKDRTAWEVSLRKREQEILLQEESLRKRREEWVDSIKGQSAQNLSISGKVVDLLNRMEWKTNLPASQVPLAPPVLPSPDLSAKPAAYRLAALMKNRISGFSRTFQSRRGAFILIALSLVLFVGAIVLWYVNDEGRRVSRAQNLLRDGNEYFSKGDLDRAMGSLETAYHLDPANSIIKNSLTLTIGELANREFREGKFEAALKRTETLGRLLPEDPDVLSLHNEILKALSGGGTPSDAATPALKQSNSQREAVSPDASVPVIKRSSSQGEAVPSLKAKPRGEKNLKGIEPPEE